MNNFWKKLDLPWRRQKYVGTDLRGNLFFQAPSIGPSYKQKRFVVWKNENDAFTPDALDVLWQSWLRHTRNEPPTLEEIKYDEQRKLLVQERVRSLNMRDNKQKSLHESTGRGETFQPGSWVPKK